jgi:hypothetical protein
MIRGKSVSPSSEFLARLRALDVCLCIGVCVAFERVFGSPSRVQHFIQNWLFGELYNLRFGVSVVDFA